MVVAKPVNSHWLFFLNKHRIGFFTMTKLRNAVSFWTLAMCEQPNLGFSICEVFKVVLLSVLLTEYIKIHIHKVNTQK